MRKTRLRPAYRARVVGFKEDCRSEGSVPAPCNDGSVERMSTDGSTGSLTLTDALQKLSDLIVLQLDDITIETKIRFATKLESDLTQGTAPAPAPAGIETMSRHRRQQGKHLRQRVEGAVFSSLGQEIGECIKPASQ